MNSTETSENINITCSSEGHSVSLSRHCNVRMLGQYNALKDCAKVRSTVISELRWDVHATQGNVIQVHKDGRLVAYQLTVKEQKCAVRVVDWETQSRVLLKGFEDTVCDLAWSNTSQPALLALIDKMGHLYVYSITRLTAQPLLTSSQLLCVRRDVSLLAESWMYRVCWCPYVPDADMESTTEDTDTVDEMAHSLAVFMGGQLEMYLVDTIIERMGDSCVNISQLQQMSGNGFYDLSNDLQNPHQSVRACCISPDATALAVGTEDGCVRFYVIEQLDDIRIAHEFVPHGGRPVTSLIFLDNMNLESSDSFWRFALTAADNNRELKLWNCENWTCTSSLSVHCAEPAPATLGINRPLRLAMDNSSSYLLLSDVTRSVLYSIELRTVNKQLQFGCFNDFALCYPILDMGIVKVLTKTYRSLSSPSANGSASATLVSDDEEDAAQNGSHVTTSQCQGVHMVAFAINQKSLLQLEMRYESATDLHPVTGAKIGFGQAAVPAYHDQLSDVSTSTVTNTSAQAHFNPIQPTPPDSARPNSYTASTYPSQAVEDVMGTSSTLPNSPFMPVSYPQPQPPPAGLPPTFPHTHKQSTVSRASPSSAEVRDILASAAPVSAELELEEGQLADDDGDNEEEEEESVFAGPGDPPYCNSSIPPRPTSPLSHTLAHDGDTPDPLNWMMHRNMSTVNKDYADPQEEMLDKLTKISMEVERLVCHSERNESDLKSMKSRLTQQSQAAQHSPLLADTVKDLSAQVAQLRNEMIENRAASVSMLNGMQSDLQNALHTSVDGSLQVLHTQIAQCLTDKLAVNETVIRDSIAKAVRSKAMSEQLGKHLSESTSAQMQASYKDTFEKLMIPSYERTTKALFDQINTVFKQGTQAYKEQLAAHVASTQAQHDQWMQQHMLNVTQAQTAHTQQVQQQLTACIQQIQHNNQQQNTALVKMVNEQLMATMGAVVRDELRRTPLDTTGLGAGYSRAQTPAPTPNRPEDLQRLINDALKQYKFDEAFQIALNAMDLTVLSFVCSRVDPSTLFSTTCALQQNTLLALIQQLSTDLNTHTDLKLRYIDDAVVSIDVNEAPRSILPSVVTTARNALQTYIAANPNTAFARRAKMTLMAVSSLINTQTQDISMSLNTPPVTSRQSSVSQSYSNLPAANSVHMKRET